MSAMLTDWPAVMPPPESVRLPAPGSVVIVTAMNAFAGVSDASLNPKSAAVNVCAMSSSVVTVRSVPVGASFTEVTPIVSDSVSVSLPPFAVPPLSVTVQLNVAGPPLAPASGVKRMP
jgi:hypothetical protein